MHLIVNETASELDFNRLDNITRNADTLNGFVNVIKTVTTICRMKAFPARELRSIVVDFAGVICKRLPTSFKLLLQPRCELRGPRCHIIQVSHLSLRSFDRFVSRSPIASGRNPIPTKDLAELSVRLE